MRQAVFLPAAALLLALAVPAPAAEPLLSLADEPPALAQPQAATPIHMDLDLAREHERFTQFAIEQVQRMNATILGGRNSMHVQKDRHGLYRASYKAIDTEGIVCQVRRAEADPNYFVGTVLYKELVLESTGRTAEACRRGSFEPVSEKASRIIYSSRPGGGWY